MKVNKVISVLQKNLPEKWIAEISIKDLLEIIRYNHHSFDVWSKFAEYNVTHVNFYQLPNDIRCEPYGAYIATIDDIGGDTWELSERYYPTDGEFGDGHDAREDRPYASDFQINIFGHYSYFAAAIKNLVAHGNSTLNHRKPQEIYV